MKRINIFLVLVLATLAPGFTRTAHAQRWDWNDEGNAAQLRNFDTFLSNHPWISKKLWEKPQRVNDRDFLNQANELRQWLENHPGAARAFQDDPAGFMDRERRFRTYGADFDSHEGRRGELARFDWFLDNHPEVRRDLMRRPELANRHEYLEHHRELREFLERHPGIREELQEHPRQFMEREERFERRSEARD